LLPAWVVLATCTQVNCEQLGFRVARAAGLRFREAAVAVVTCCPRLLLYSSLILFLNVVFTV